MARGGAREALRGARDSRGFAVVGVLGVVLLVVVPFLVGAGNPSSFVDALRSTAWLVDSDGDLRQVSGLTSEQLSELTRDRDAGFDEDAQVAELDTLVYVLSARRLVGIDTVTGRELAGSGVRGDQLLVHEGRVYVVDTEERAVHQIEAGSARAAETRRVPGDGAIGQSALDDNGSLWVPDASSGVVHRYRDGDLVDSDTAVPGSGALDVAAVGPRVVAVRSDDGEAREITLGEVRRPIDLGGGGIVVPVETLPDDGPLVVARGAVVVRVDLTSREVVESEDLGGGELTPPVISQGRIVVLHQTDGEQATLYVLQLVDGELTVVEQEAAEGFDIDRTTIRTRDGIAYVNDPEADIGFVVEGDDVREGDRTQDPDLPGRPTVEPEEPPAPVTPPSTVPGEGETQSTDPRGTEPTPTTEPGTGDGGDDPGGGDPGGGDPGGGDPGGGDPAPTTTCADAARDQGGAGTLQVDGEVGVRQGTATYSFPGLPEAVRQACAGGSLQVRLDLQDGAGAASAQTIELGLGETSGEATFDASVTLVRGSHLLLPGGGASPITLGSSAQVAVPAPEEPTSPGGVVGLTSAEEGGDLVTRWTAPASGATTYGVTIGGLTGEETVTDPTTSHTYPDVPPGTHEVAVRAFIDGTPGPVETVSVTIVAATPAMSITLQPVAGNRPTLNLVPQANGGQICDVLVTGPQGESQPIAAECNTTTVVNVDFFASSYTATPVAVDGVPATGAAQTVETFRASLRALATGTRDWYSTPGVPGGTYDIGATCCWSVECITADRQYLRPFKVNGGFAGSPVPADGYVLAGDFELVQGIKTC